MVNKKNAVTLLSFVLNVCSNTFKLFKMVQTVEKCGQFVFINKKRKNCQRKSLQESL